MNDATPRPTMPRSPTAAGLSPAELDGLSAYGRRDHTFQAAARHVIGLRLLLLTDGLRADTHAREGLERAEAVALLSLALGPASTLVELRQRETLFDGGCGSAFKNLSSMLAASLSADAERLGTRRLYDAWPEFHKCGSGQTTPRREQASVFSREGCARG